MAEYVYRCPACGNETDVEEPMLSVEKVWCNLCGEVMRRKPHKLRVNWNGVKPSQGGVGSDIMKFIEDAPRRREEQHG